MLSYLHHSTTILPPPSARHYHSTLSIWLSVDPMSDKYPGVSPYVYCANNPVVIKDEDGRDWWIPEGNSQPVFDPDITKDNCPNTGTYLGKECDWQKVNMTERTVYNCHGTKDGSYTSNKLEIRIKPQSHYYSYRNWNVRREANHSHLGFFSDYGIFMSIGLESIKNEFPDNKSIKWGTSSVGFVMAGFAIFETLSSNKSTAEKVFDTGTNMIGSMGWKGLFVSTVLQAYKDGAKFFIECKQKIDSKLQEISTPNYWWNW
ncbi:MAG: hypothetical protein MJZ49_04625 [Bacteroidales bacterium]|nr:hypothetical protein [Bacteroidales bacterium]